jgi:hypothetical protein
MVRREGSRCRPYGLPCGYAPWPNMVTAPLTLVGNSADSRGLAQCRDIVYCTPPRPYDWHAVPIRKGSWPNGIKLVESHFLIDS